MQPPNIVGSIGVPKIKDFIFVFNVAGKRHGKGKGVIFSLSTVGQVAAEHGVYSGEWRLNMRFE